MNASKRKLIEVRLPLNEINREAAREKSIRHGHPSTLHLWWARRPLAACRAVLWASLVDDPSAHPEQFPTEEAQKAERKRLFRILEDLVVWENSNSADVLAAARAEVERCFPDGPPAVLDPFAGGGSIPLEAQRLGLKALAGDLNPVAVLINRAMIEIPPRFANQPPVHPDMRNDLLGTGRRQVRSGGMVTFDGAVGAYSVDIGRRQVRSGGAVTSDGAVGAYSVDIGRKQVRSGGTATPLPAGEKRPAWNRAQGLAADIKAYGAWMRDEASRKIGYLYPDAVGQNGEALTPVAWIWARTVESPDPAWKGHVPLVSSWTLRKAKKGKPEVWVQPMVDSAAQTINYKVNYGSAGGGGGNPVFAGDKARQRYLCCYRCGDSGGSHPGRGTGGTHGGAPLGRRC